MNSKAAKEMIKINQEALKHWRISENYKYLGYGTLLIQFGFIGHLVSHLNSKESKVSAIGLTCTIPAEVFFGSKFVKNRKKSIEIYNFNN